MEVGIRLPPSILHLPPSPFPLPISNFQLPISKGHVLSPLSLGTVLDRTVLDRTVQGTVQCQRTRGLSKGGT